MCQGGQKWNPCTPYARLVYIVWRICPGERPASTQRITGMPFSWPSARVTMRKK